MALTNTMGTYFAPFLNRGDEVTPRRAEYLQTTAVAANATGAAMFGSATSSNDFHLTYCHFSVTNPSTTAIGTLYLVTTPVATIQDVTGVGTSGSYVHSFNFGPVGAMCGTTTTHTAYIKFAATVTSVTFYAQGYRYV